ncbi:MAG: hypothetical protein RLN70_11775, partial [Rhodospirillaceae bacterium]
MSQTSRRNGYGLPVEEGMYDPLNEHDACGFGFIADIHNQPRHEIVHQALEIVHHMDHRGAIGADPMAGDGAGILIQLPDAFIRKVFAKQGVEVPAKGDYALGMVFLPRDHKLRDLAIKAIEKTTAAEGQILLGWRDVPTDNSVLGESVKPNEPVIRQVLIQRGPDTADNAAFERKLY